MVARAEPDRYSPLARAPGLGRIARAPVALAELLPAIHDADCPVCRIVPGEPPFPGVEPTRQPGGIREPGEAMGTFREPIVGIFPQHCMISVRTMTPLIRVRNLNRFRKTQSDLGASPD